MALAESMVSVLLSERSNHEDVIVVALAWSAGFRCQGDIICPDRLGSDVPLSIARSDEPSASVSYTMPLRLPDRHCREIIVARIGIAGDATMVKGELPSLRAT